MIDKLNYKIIDGRRAAAKRCRRLAHWCAVLAAASLTLYAAPGYAVGVAWPRPGARGHTRSPFPPTRLKRRS